MLPVPGWGRCGGARRSGGTGTPQMFPASPTSKGRFWTGWRVASALAVLLSMRCAVGSRKREKKSLRSFWRIIQSIHAKAATPLFFAKAERHYSPRGVSPPGLTGMTPMGFSRSASGDTDGSEDS